MSKLGNVPNMCQILKSYFCNEKFQIHENCVQICEAPNAELYDAIVEMETYANFFFLSCNFSIFK